jgi:hypothetical protein
MVSIPDEVLGFSIDLIIPNVHYGPEVDSASNRNEYQESSVRTASVPVEIRMGKGKAIPVNRP